MGKKRKTVKVKQLNKRKGKRSKNPVYAVYINDKGREYRVPNTDTRNRKVAVKTAKKIRANKERY